MPSGLRVATFLCCLFSIFAPSSLLPGGTYRIDGVSVDFNEFWRRGRGPMFFAFGVVCALLAYGFLRARGWSRLLFVLVILTFTLTAVFLAPVGRIQGIATSVAASGFAFWYMFRRRTVRAYFSKNNGPPAQPGESRFSAS